MSFDHFGKDSSASINQEECNRERQYLVMRMKFCFQDKKKHESRECRNANEWKQYFPCIMK